MQTVNPYVIITDATADLPADIAAELGVTVIPMEFQLSGQTYEHFADAHVIPIPDVYNRLRNGEPASTSQINAYTYVQYFEPFFQEGKDILYIAFSSGLSGTQQAAVIAANELTEKHPELKFSCVASLCASMGEGLFLYTASTKKECGLLFDELNQWLLDNRLHLCHWFTVDDLNHLKRGGRISGATAAIGSILNIKPVMHVDDEGHLIAVSKVRGRKKSLISLVDHMEKTYYPDKNDIIFIGHGDSLEDAEFVRDLVQEKFGISNILIGYIGPVIGAHSGPGTIALFFFGSQR